MTHLLSGDLTSLALPEDLPRLREAITAAENHQVLAPLYQALATEHPVALLDLVIGPRAASTAAAVRAALGVISLLEQQAPPSAVYRRLLEVRKDTRAEVLQIAADRNPAAGWLVQLSDLAEDVPGVAHLTACSTHPAFPAICWAHAGARHLDALVEASATGRAEPAAALLSIGQRDKAVEAAARALAANPSSPVVPYLAAVGGPHIQAVLIQIVPRLLSAEAGAALRRPLSPFPEASQLLASALRGMR